MTSNTIHKALNGLDHLPPPNYANVVLYLPLKADVSPKEAFAVLQEGLQRTFAQLPWLDGKVYPVSPTQAPDRLEIRFRPQDPNAPPPPRQLRFNELDCSETYDELRESAFHPGGFEDAALTWAPFLPNVTNGADVLVSQANFLPNGCVLTAAICHAVSDGMGVNCVLKIWADNCRALQLGEAPQPTQPPEISDHDLVDRALAKTEKGMGKTIQEIPPNNWRLLALEPPPTTTTTGDEPATAATNGENHTEPAPEPVATSNPETPKKFMKSYIFYMSSANVTSLRDECASEPGASDISVNDAICALVWRSLLKARSMAPGVDAKAVARLDLPFDVRPYFPQFLPANYLGNCTMVNQAVLPLSRLVASSTSIGLVARAIRQVASEVTPARLMDAYALAKTLPARGQGPKLQNLRVDGNGLMITSLLAFPTAEICFGGNVFANGGRPEAARPLLGAINKVFRYCAILPRKSYGGVEFVANMFDEEMDVLVEDGEFGKYVVLVA